MNMPTETFLESMGKFFLLETALTTILIIALIITIYMLAENNLLRKCMAAAARRAERRAGRAQQQEAQVAERKQAAPQIIAAANIQAQPAMMAAFNANSATRTLIDFNKTTPLSKATYTTWEIKCKNILTILGLTSVTLPIQQGVILPHGLTQEANDVVFSALTTAMLDGDLKDHYIQHMETFNGNGQVLWHAIRKEYGSDNVNTVTKNITALNKLENLLPGEAKSNLVYINEYTRLFNTIPALQRPSAPMAKYALKSQLTTQMEHSVLDRLFGDDGDRQVLPILREITRWIREAETFAALKARDGTTSVAMAAVNIRDSKDSAAARDTARGQIITINVPKRYATDVKRLLNDPCCQCNKAGHVGAACRTVQTLVAEYREKHKSRPRSERNEEKDDKKRTPRGTRVTNLTLLDRQDDSDNSDNGDASTRISLMASTKSATAPVPTRISLMAFHRPFFRPLRNPDGTFMTNEAIENIMHLHTTAGVYVAPHPLAVVINEPLHVQPENADIDMDEKDILPSEQAKVTVEEESVPSDRITLNAAAVGNETLTDQSSVTVKGHENAVTIELETPYVIMSRVMKENAPAHQYIIVQEYINMQQQGMSVAATMQLLQDEEGWTEVTRTVGASKARSTPWPTIFPLVEKNDITMARTDAIVTTFIPEAAQELIDLYDENKEIYGKPPREITVIATIVLADSLYGSDLANAIKDLEQAGEAMEKIHACRRNGITTEDTIAMVSYKLSKNILRYDLPRPYYLQTEKPTSTAPSGESVATPNPVNSDNEDRGQRRQLSPSLPTLVSDSSSGEEEYQCASPMTESSTYSPASSDVDPGEFPPYAPYMYTRASPATSSSSTDDENYEHLPRVMVEHQGENVDNISLMHKLHTGAEQAPTAHPPEITVTVDTCANCLTCDTSLQQYMTDVNLFNDSTPETESRISGIGTTRAIGTGTLLIRTKTENCKLQELEFKKVYIIPHLKEKLGIDLNMSVSLYKLVTGANPTGFVDLRDGSYLQLPSGDKIRTHQDSNNLPCFIARIGGYKHTKPIVKVTVRTKDTKTREVITPEALLLEHQQMGHMNFHSVLDIKNQKCSGSLPICPCMEQNLRKEPVATNSKGEFKDRKMGTVFFSDLKGPMPKATNGDLWILSAVDSTEPAMSFSTAIRSKNDTVRGFTNLTDQMRARGLRVGPGCKPVVIFADNGKGEFRSEALATYFRGNGLTLRTTAPGTPQQNYAERHWQNLIPGIKALMGSVPGGTPRAWWPYALQHVEWLRFTVPLHKGQKNIKDQVELKTRFHVPDNKVSTDALLFAKVIAHHSNDTQPAGALAPKGYEGIYMGFCPTNGTALVFNLETRSITETRNATILPEYTNAFAKDPQFVSNDRVISTADTVENIRNLNPEGKKLTVKQRAALKQGATAAYRIEPEPETQTAPEQKQVAPETYKAPTAIQAEAQVEKPAPPTCILMASVSHFADRVSTQLGASADAPKSMLKMLSHQNSARWMTSYKKELDDNIMPIIEGPFMRSDIPADAQVLNSLPQFKVKRDSKMEEVSFKSRLCLDGSTQTMIGSNYAPTVSSQIVKTVLSINAIDKFYMKQIDVSGAFRYSELDPNEKPVYFRFPRHDPYMDSTQYWLLTKSSYGLRNAPIMWYKHFTGVLLEMGLTCSVVDPCL
jgi:Reverse transcriptase (RNA-dependent DNA polymerase)